VRLGMTTLEELLRVMGPQLVYQRHCECGRSVDAKFLFCPFCGTFRQNFCRVCRVSLEESWINCPHCGTAKEPPG
jgi:hypothetical protein